MHIFSEFLLLLLLTLNSCTEEFEDVVPELEGVPAGGLTSVRVTNVTNDVAELEVNLFVVDHFGDFITKLSESNFEISNVRSNFEAFISSISEENDVERGPFSASLLFDQSGSINSTDPKNARIEAGVAFADIVNNGDEAAVAAFSSGGNYQNPYELLVNFTKQPDQLIPAIESLSGRAGGGTPLYRAIYNLIPYTSDGKNDNKAIVAFTDGEDTDGGVGFDELIQRACSNNVRVYTVGLGGGVDERVLSRIAFETGGAVMLAEDALQLISLYNSLGDLLHGRAKFYKLKLQVKRKSGDWQLGDIISGAIDLPLSSAINIEYPFEVEITNRHVGRWYERLPPCPCTYEEAQQLVNTEDRKSVV